MFCKEERIVLKLMLQKLNRGQRQVGEEEIKTALQEQGRAFLDDDDDAFRSSGDILNHLQELKLIYKRRDCPICDILVDIATLRALFLPEKEEVVCQKQVKLKELLETEWFLENSEKENKGDDDAGSEENEQENADDSEDDYIKEFFEDFKEDLKKIIGEEGEEDDASDEEDEEDEEKEGEEMTPEQLLQKRKREKTLIESLQNKNFSIDLTDKEEYEGAVMDIIEAVVAVDSKNTRSDAIRICRELLLRVRRSRWKSLFERAHKEFIIASDDEYEMLRKQIFGE